MDRYADVAANIEAKADLIEGQMPEVVASRNAVEIIRGCDRYGR